MISDGVFMRALSEAIMSHSCFLANCFLCGIGYAGIFVFLIIFS